MWDGEPGAALQFLTAARDGGPPLLFTGAADGLVKLFDLRGPGGTAASKLRVHDGPLVRSAASQPASLLSATRCCVNRMLHMSGVELLHNQLEAITDLFRAP